MILITGGAGYLGGLLAERLNSIGKEFISIDLLPVEKKQACGHYYQGDLCDSAFLATVFQKHAIDTVFHFATQIDFNVKDQAALYKNNVQSTENIAACGKKFKIKKLIFTSSNSVYLGNDFLNPFSEKDQPIPIDAYGKSKIACEKLLAFYQQDFHTITFRCPNIIDAGRVGMLSILFDFLRENKTCWMIGSGNIKHQCLYAQDLLDAMLLALNKESSYTFNIGAESVSSFREMSRDLIANAHSQSKIKKTPTYLVVPLLKLLYQCGLSPLGPYQFRMLTKNFSFDIAHVKQTLQWQPSLSNSQMLIKAYDFYVTHRDEIRSNTAISANKGKINLGILKLIKLFS